MSRLFRSRKHDSQAGFTLAEIVIVFAIIGLLSTYMMGSSFIGARRRARDSQRRAQIRDLAIALEQYYNDYDRYPASNANGQIVACGAGGNNACAWGSEFSDTNGTIYMGKLPEETATSNRFVYRTGPAGLAWQIYVALEEDDYNDIDRNNDGRYTQGGDGYTFVDCGPGYCMYGVSSGNISPETSSLAGY